MTPRTALRRLRPFSRFVVPFGLLVAITASPNFSTVDAHEFWLTPNAGEPRTGDPIAFRLSIGDGFAKAEPFPRDSSHLKRFWVQIAGAEFDVPGIEGAPWVGAVRPVVAGPLSVGYSSRPNRVELTGAAFDRYLVEEGLVAAQRLRLERREVGQPATESFRRCAKSVVHVSERVARSETKADRPSPPAAPTRLDTSLGLELEISPVTNPQDYRPGAPFLLRVERLGKPAPNMKVRAQCAEHPRLRVSGRTDASGNVTLTLPDAGFWLFSTVAMNRLAPGAATDWESVWSSLTLTVDSEESEASSVSADEAFSPTTEPAGATDSFDESSGGRPQTSTEERTTPRE
ncbi:MAG: DUF4198 domain-containing protein [Planctomycetota bacterium]